jgi:hypothetical protein
MENNIPEIKRSRAYLIYDTKGRRYLDFYQDSGRAILGHRMEGISRVIKSTVARGLIASYPSIYIKRVYKELSLLFPDALEFRIYGNMERAMDALSLTEQRKVSVNNFIDFPSRQSEFVFWRPFLGSKLNWKIFDYIIPILPFPGNFGPTVVIVNKNKGILPDSDELSPMICDILIKSTASLIQVIKKDECSIQFDLESPLWQRIGPYLKFQISGDEYSLLYRKALKNSVLLPPESCIPGIIPCQYENAQLKGFIRMIRLVESKLSARPCNQGLVESKLSARQ